MRLAGFHQVDTQVAFRIGLSRIESTPSLERLSAISAEEEPFEVLPEDLMPFAHERFRFLPGITQGKLNERYALWSTRLIEKQPAWCLRVLDGTAVQGWFLSQAPPGEPVELTLAMLKSDAQISGLLLYQKAMLEYAARGARVGHAAFSVTNTRVMNIYSSLGARFLTPRGHWFRLAAGSGGSGA